jgi:hypothetical protein
MHARTSTRSRGAQANRGTVKRIRACMDRVPLFHGKDMHTGIEKYSRMHTCTFKTGARRRVGCVCTRTTTHMLHATQKCGRASTHTHTHTHAREYKRTIYAPGAARACTLAHLCALICTCVHAQHIPCSRAERACVCLARARNAMQ